MSDSVKKFVDLVNSMGTQGRGRAGKSGLIVSYLAIYGPLLSEQAGKIKERKPFWRRWLGPAGTRTVARAEQSLDLLSALVPRRIANEEIGDALEVIQGMAKARRPRWFIALKVATTFFWVGVHTLLHCAERVAGIVKAVTGKSEKD